MFEIGDTVRMIKPPRGCCGMIRQGYFGTVETVIEMENMGTGEEKQILILEDDTLVWSTECELIRSVGGVS